MTITIEELAKKALGYVRDDYGRVFANDDAPDWIDDMVDKSRNNKFILDALSMIDDGDTDDRYVEGDIYTGDLLDWFVFDVSKIGYVNDAVEENGYPGDIIEAIRMGQLRERLEIFNIVLAALELELELDEEEEE